ncbi:MAG: hypothetical protein MUE30_07100, partial [Spirosomaceae bacterium]|nr:hypothetical protein [Spirosomataceae bacterium]
MKKTFNVTGICRPAKHYMADISRKLDDTLNMIDEGLYFIINRPRQYGKTTMLYTIATTLRKQKSYVVFNISFEGVGDLVFTDESRFAKMFLELLETQAQIFSPELCSVLAEEIQKTN